jgi:hypothetical protein
MAAWTEARWFMRLLGDTIIGRRRHELPSVTRQENRALAEAMRRLPGRYSDRLAPRTLQRITGAAAAGQWERAVDQLITALGSGSAPLTDDERTELARC